LYSSHVAAVWQAVQKKNEKRKEKKGLLFLLNYGKII